MTMDYSLEDQKLKFLRYIDLDSMAMKMTAT